MATTVATIPLVGPMSGLLTAAGTAVAVIQNVDTLQTELYKEAFYKAKARADANVNEKARIETANRGITEKQYKFDQNRADRAESDKMLDAKELYQKYTDSDKGIMANLRYALGTGDRALLRDEIIVKHTGNVGPQTTYTNYINNNLQDNTRQQTNNNFQLPQPKNGFGKYTQTRSNTNSVTLRDSMDLNKQRAGIGYTEKIAEQGVQLRSADIQKTSQAIEPTSTQVEVDAGQVDAGYGSYFVDAMVNNAMFL